jgi:hypothetical protein
VVCAIIVAPSDKGVLDESGVKAFLKTLHPEEMEFVIIGGVTAVAMVDTKSLLQWSPSLISVGP